MWKCHLHSSCRLHSSQVRKKIMSISTASNFEVPYSLPIWTHICSCCLVCNAIRCWSLFLQYSRFLIASNMVTCSFHCFVFGLCGRMSLKFCWNVLAHIHILDSNLQGWGSLVLNICLLALMGWAFRKPQDKEQENQINHKTHVQIRLCLSPLRVWLSGRREFDWLNWQKGWWEV